MTVAVDRLDIEQQVAELLSTTPGDSIGVRDLAATSRETALALLCRAAQESTDIRHLLEAGGSLAASALATELFAVAELHPGSRTMTVISGQQPTVQPARQYELDEDADESALAFAATSIHPVLLTDLDNEPRFDDPSLKNLGVRSGLLCPLIYRQRPQGVIGVFTSELRDFQADDALCLHAFAGLLGPTIAHQRAERALADQNKFVASTIDSLESIVLLLAADGRILQINRAGQSISGFRIDEINGRSFGGAFLLPEEVELVQDALGQLGESRGPVRCESFLLTRDATRRRVAWSFSRLPFEAADGPAIIASGIDISEQYAAIVRLNNSGEDSTEGSYESPPLILPIDADVPSDRRGQRRLDYPYVQSIGPCREGVMPGNSDFRNVRCRDISPTGFAYLDLVEPAFDELIVKLGPASSQLFLRARVAHTTPVQHEGQSMHLVGCEYIARIDL